MNSPFVIDQSVFVTELKDFQSITDDRRRISWLSERLLQRTHAGAEVGRVLLFANRQRRMTAKIKRPDRLGSLWPLVAQSLMMSNEFLYVD